MESREYENAKRKLKLFFRARGETIIAYGVFILSKRFASCALPLTDVVMPGINGRAQADRVAFLQKPYTSEALARKVRDVLDT
jgi:hypothetical protein